LIDAENEQWCRYKYNAVYEYCWYVLYDYASCTLAMLSQIEQEEVTMDRLATPLSSTLLQGEIKSKEPRN
jgi:hypothetical protein